MPRNASAWLSGLSNLIVPLLLLLPILWALLPGGLPNTADGMVHFTRVSEIVSSWRDGIFLPRWSLNLGFGLGIPVFIYGPPFSYLIAAGYHSLGLPPEAAFKTMIATALILGTTGVYRLGQLFFGVWAGAVAVAAMIYAPVTLYTLFVQGNTPQLLAWSFLPWALWAIIQIYRTPSQRGQLGYALLLALTVAGTLVSHNVVALILSQTIAVLAIMMWLATRRHRGFWLTLAGSALGLLLSAWFSVPALLETRYVSINAIEEVDYRPHFVPLRELLTWPPRLDTGALNPYIPRSLGTLQLLLGCVSIVLLGVWAIKQRTPLMEANGNRPLFVRVFWGTSLFMGLYALVCGLMATRWSTPVWDALPFVDVFQFPARWNSFSGLGLAWLAAVVVGLTARRLQPLVAGALILLLMGAALVNLYPQKTLPGSRTLSPYEVVRYEVRSGATGTTSYGEFNPMWAPRPLPHSSLIEDYLAQRPVDRLKGVLPEDASHQVLDVTAHRQLYQILLLAPATVSLNLLYFPGWRAEVNRKPVAVRPQDGTGLLTVDLPAGDNLLELTFGPTPLRRAMGLVSVLAWCGIVVAFVLLLAQRWRALERPHPNPPQVGVGFLSARHAITLISAAVLIVWALQLVGQNWFQFHSTPDQALLAPIQRSDDVAGRFRLLGLDPLPTTVYAGDSLTVVPYWRALHEMDENYAAVLRLEEVGSRRTLTEIEQSHPSDIPTSSWATGLYLRDSFDMQVPADALPIQYAVGVGFREPATGDMLPVDQGTTVELGRLWVLPNEEPDPPAGPRVRFGPAIEFLGAHTDPTHLTLYWRADKPIAGDYSIFVHLLDTQGQVVGQMDGTPYDNRYPLWAWQPGQIIEDQRNLETAAIDSAQVNSVAIGIYALNTGERLAAINANGKALPNNAQIISW